MQELIEVTIADASDLAGISSRMRRFLGEIKDSSQGRIGVVSGIISSDGPGRIVPNLERLAEYTSRIRQAKDFPIFSAADIFTQALYDRLEDNGHTVEDYLTFWRDLYGSGYITDAFFTPGWDRSLGATDEHETAKRLGLRIHYIYDSEMSRAGEE